MRVLSPLTLSAPEARPWNSIECSRPIQSAGFPDRRCRRCPECLRFKAWDWKKRINAEVYVAGWSALLTLTFRDRGSYVFNKSNPGCEKVGYEDVKLWIKRLRASYGSLRYCNITEWGPRTQRLHFHCLLHGAGDKPKGFNRGSRKRWKQGISHHRHPKDDYGSYLAKYINKEAGSRPRPSNAYGSQAGRIIYDQVASHSMVQLALQASPEARIVGIKLGPRDALRRMYVDRADKVRHEQRTLQYFRERKLELAEEAGTIRADRRPD